MSILTIARRMSGATCVLLAVSAGAALAEPTAAPSPSPSAPPEIGHVVTSDRQDQSLRTTAKTTYVVMKSQMIARGYQNVADALASISGVIVQRYGALGSLADVGIRGATSGQVLILLDGRPAAGAQTGTLDLGEISTSGVERIEVVEGGGSTLYGNRAIGGVINIITTSPANARPLVKISSGSFATNTVDIESRNLTFARTVAKNDYGFVASSAPAGNRIDDDLEQTTARLRGDARFGAIRIDASMGLASVHLGIPGPLGNPFLPSPAPVVTPNPALAGSYQSATTRQNATSGDARLTLSLAKPQATTTLDLTATRQQLEFYSLPGDFNGCFNGLGTQPCDDLDQESRLQVSLRNAIASTGNRLLFGLDAARGTARIDAGGVPPPVSGFAQTALYAQESHDFGNASFYAGLRGERDGGQGGALSPSVGFIVHLTPQLALKSNYGTAFRSPNAVDLYYPGFSNPNLQPERTQAADLTASVDGQLGAIALGAFTLTGTNLIEPNAQFTHEINVGRASIAGLTLDARTHAYHGITTRLGITNLYRALDLTAQAMRLPRRPVFTTSLGADYTAGSARAALTAAGFSLRTNSADPPYPPPGTRYDPYFVANAFSVLDAYVRFRIAPLVVLSLRAQNLGNERYAAVASYPAPGRSFSVELATQ